MNNNVGVQLEPGQKLTEICKTCNAKIIFTNGESRDWLFINRCPQCGVVYDTSDVHESALLLSVDDVQRKLLRFRNIRLSTGDDKWPEELRSNLLTLIDELASLQIDHSKWHSCRCMECHWTGYNPNLHDSGLNAGKGFCPKCQSLNVEAIPGRNT